MFPNNTIDKIISPLIESQFPQFYETDGPMFISFVTAYYQWMEAQNPGFVGSIITQSRSLLDYWDSDTTLERFIKFFKDEFLVEMPNHLAVDKRFIIKHVLDYYRSKGTQRGFELLFRILYNQDVKVNSPGDYMFRLSNGTWRVPRYIEVADNPFLGQLDNLLITSSSGASGVVESYARMIINNKVTNVLYLSDVSLNFKLGDFIFCNEIPGFFTIIIGSLSALTLENGGLNFSVGDELNINGSGYGGIARVVSTVSENGLVSFNLLNGGYGYAVNSVIAVNSSNTGGSGAGFQIGGITDVQTILLDTDTIAGALATVLDLSTQGMIVNINNASGSFQNGELAQGNALSLQLVVDIIASPSGFCANGESVSNSVLGINGVLVYYADVNDLYLTGTSAVLNNANLSFGAIIVSNTSSCVMRIQVVEPVQNVIANGFVIGSGSNTTVLTVDRLDAADIGYYIEGMTITGNISGMTATVNNAIRLTNWDYFPEASNGSNLDSIIGDSFTFVQEQIGRIAFIDNQNPGSGYTSAPTVSVINPLVAELQIPDGFGGFWGQDAVVNAVAGSSNGVVTALAIADAGFSYTPGEYLTMTSANSDVAVFGRAIVDTAGIGQGYWKDTQSFLSDSMVLQDSYYYQVFSYELVSEQMLNNYEKFIKDLTHPVGYALFGKYAVNRTFNFIGPTLASSEVFEVPEIIFYTADSVFFTCDEITVTVDQSQNVSYDLLDSLGDFLFSSDGNNLIYSSSVFVLSGDGLALFSSDGSELTVGQ
jgi:hypothetical protein